MVRMGAPICAGLAGCKLPAAHRGINMIAAFAAAAVCTTRHDKARFVQAGPLEADV